MALTMPAPRETWTDERLDDLNQRVDAGFREQREEMRALRAEMQALRVEVQGGFARVDARSDRLQVVMIAALLTIVLGFVADRF